MIVRELSRLVISSAERADVSVIFQTEKVGWCLNGSILKQFERRLRS